MTGSVHQNLPLFYTNLHSTNGRNSLDIKFYKLERTVLTGLHYLMISVLKMRYKHLYGLHFHKGDTYDDYKIHLLIGTGDIVKTKLNRFMTKNDGEFIA